MTVYNQLTAKEFLMDEAKNSLLISIQCIICKEIVEDDHMVCDSKGMHRTCIGCCEVTNKECSACKNKLLPKYDNIIGQIAAAMQLERRCANYASGCETTILQADYENHLNSCEFMQMSCHNMNCKHKFNITKDDMESHLSHMIEVHKAIKIGHKELFKIGDNVMYIMPVNDDMFALIKTYNDAEGKTYFPRQTSKIFAKLFWINRKSRKDSYSILFTNSKLGATANKTCDYSAYWMATLGTEETFIEVV